MVSCTEQTLLIVEEPEPVRIFQWNLTPTLGQRVTVLSQDQRQLLPPLVKMGELLLDAR